MAWKEKGMWGFRCFGYGLSCKNTRLHRKLWSDRNRIFWQLEIGPWLLTPLKRGDRGFRRHA